MNVKNVMKDVKVVDIIKFLEKRNVINVRQRKERRINILLLIINMNVIVIQIQLKKNFMVALYQIIMNIVINMNVLNVKIILL